MFYIYIYKIYGCKQVYIGVIKEIQAIFLRDLTCVLHMNS